MTEVGHKLHNLLLSLTSGGECRSQALPGKLCTTLNPRALASGVTSISQALNPPKIMDAKKADMPIEVWEDKLVKITAEYGETLSNKVKVPVLCSMFPRIFRRESLIGVRSARTRRRTRGPCSTGSRRK